MTVMPVGMLAYMRLTAADYMGAVYHNPMGIVVMTVALFVYAGSIWLGRHIINISI
jgi:tight adherence protein B